mmetsp:Transcript_40336/g.77320  ORF Transcript_40336/g.77320 Transcript_40336/m.77320 type:complete len:506 (-) Transcript_40336:303-1820(-)
MILCQIVAASFLITGPAVASPDDPQPVVSITKKEWDTFLATSYHALVNFYAPWCGHSKKLNPEFDRAAQNLESTGVKLVKVDAFREKDLAAKYDIKGFPTVVWFEGGKQVEYDGGRTANNITEWVKSALGPAVVEMNPGSTPTPEDGKPVLVLYADAIRAGFEEAAKANRKKASWRFVPSPGQSKIVIVHPNEDPFTFLGSIEDEEEITNFLMDNLLPTFGKLDADTFEKYVKAGKGLVWSLFPIGEADFGAIQAKYRPIMGEVAKKFRGKYFVTYTDVVKLKEPLEKMFGPAEYPAIAVQRKAGEKKKYLYKGEMTVQKITDFINGVDAGLVPPTLRSQQPPVPHGGAVTPCVGSTLRKTIFSPDKDALLQVHAPWCGSCKKLDKEYNKLARKLQKEKLTGLITLAKIDGSANDSPVDSMDWTSFPAVYFVKAGTREAIEYEGERTAKGLWKYLKKHSTKAHEIRDRQSKKSLEELQKALTTLQDKLGYSDSKMDSLESCMASS